MALRAKPETGRLCLLTMGNQQSSNPYTMASKDTWVIFRLKSQPFAIASSSVREMVPCRQEAVASVPNAPAHIRGVISLRKEVMPLVDLRVQLGLPSLAEECRSSLELAAAREQDHRNWIKELEACANENRAFTKATDPNQCAFGKWYNSIKVTDHILAAVLERFDAPHKLIHASALEVIQLLKEDRKPDALTVVERVKKGPFLQMMTLFKEFSTTLADTYKEIAVVIETGNRTFAITVDLVEAVEEISLEDLPLGGYMKHSEAVEKVGRRKGRDELVMVLSADRLAPESA